MNHIYKLLKLTNKITVKQTLTLIFFLPNYGMRLINLSYDDNMS